LKGIDLTIGPGSVAIIGQNGAGKSTFVRLLNGLLKPGQGSVTVDGLSTAAVSVATMARQVGLVFQNPADQLFRSRVLDEAMFGPLNLGLKPEEARQRALAALVEVGLLDEADRNPYDLGLAQRKLVTVAGVLAMATPVVVLDEPTIAQDRAGVRQLGEIVTRLKAAGRTIITITHDMEFVARYFDRVLVFQDGHVLADDQAGSVFTQPSLLKAAGLEPPQITSLGLALGLAEPVLTVEAFVEAMQRKEQ
ncbi:MAG: energy-coupling factor ABC transporter ATP-binding protein, partial [Mycobacterium leprae]